MITKESLRARFAELQTEIETIEAVSGPLRVSRDDLVNAARADEELLNGQIATAEEGLLEKKQELAMIVRALNGKTGSDAGEA